MTRPDRYSRPQIVLHWLTLALLLVSWLSHGAMKDTYRAVFREGAGATPGAAIHIAAGLSLLAIVLFRLGLRLIHGAPALPEGSRLLNGVAHLSHWLLYALLLALPLSGIAAWFFLNRSAGEAHETLFGIGLALVALHAAAALFHHYWLKDGLLLRMTRPSRAG